MKYRPTQEELDIINKCLPLINPSDDSFSISHIHADKLKEIYPSIVNGIRNSDYDNAFSDLNRRGVYQNITKWLKEQDFAVDVLPHKYSNSWDLKFTSTGDLLWAYSDVYKYYDSFNEHPIEIIQKRAQELIKEARTYNEFRIVQYLPKVDVVHFSVSDMDNDLLEKISSKISGKSSLISLHEQWILDESAVNFLTAEGFVINRHDIKDSDGGIYRELTDRGRKLKEVGSLDELKKMELVELKKQNDIKELEFNLLKSQDEFQKLNNDFIVKQSSLIANQIETNEKVTTTNTRMVWILIITFFAAAVSAYAAVVGVNNDQKEILLLSEIDSQKKAILLQQQQLQTVHLQVDSLEIILSKLIKKP